MMGENVPVQSNEDNELTRSQIVLLELLRKRGRTGVTPKELMEDVSFAPRTVRYALRRLLSKKLVRRVPCLADMRQYVYVATR